MTDAFLALITATALLLGSPGPAPLALAGAGAAFGIRAGLPFLLGILIGLAAAMFGAALGLAALFAAYPAAAMATQALGALYIAYVAYKIATGSVEPDGNGHASGPPNFRDGFLLNLLNPKAYAAFLALFSQFLLPFQSAFLAFLVTALVCMAVGTVVDIVWLSFGGVLRPVFRRPRAARALRVSFAVLMLLALAWVFIRQGMI